MKTNIIKTLKTFDIEGCTYYLDQLTEGYYLISKDEKPIQKVNSLEYAEFKFNELAQKHNAIIEAF